MEKLFKRSILSTIICLALMFFIINATSFAQEKKAGSKKAYDEIGGRYEFDIEGQIMVIAFWVERRILIASISETSPKPIPTSILGCDMSTSKNRLR